jgi:hypothetical protein
MSDFPLLLASEMGVTRRTVTRWCTAGKVPGRIPDKGRSLATSETEANRKMLGKIRRQNHRVRSALYFSSGLPFVGTSGHAAEQNRAMAR